MVLTGAPRRGVSTICTLSASLWWRLNARLALAFSEIEKFLDTPVKRYSSGMYVRLAFSAAIHVDP